MTDQLGVAGFTTGTPTNALEKVADSVVHFTDADGAQEVAESVAAQLGGVEASAMPDPIDAPIRWPEPASGRRMRR